MATFSINLRRVRAGAPLVSGAFSVAQDTSVLIRLVSPDWDDAPIAGAALNVVLERSTDSGATWVHDASMTTEIGWRSTRDGGLPQMQASFGGGASVRVRAVVDSAADFRLGADVTVF